jgi:ribulose-5-phosphate 4-epimerase/fuculose-1-phosphate aldolase
MSLEQECRVKTAALTRMLNLQGVIGMFGHVSIRVPGTDKCFISPGASTEKSTVRPQDVFLYDIDGTIIEHPYPDPSRPGRRDVRVPSACAGGARARDRRQVAQADVPARRVSLHRRADLG